MDVTKEKVNSIKLIFNIKNHCDLLNTQIIVIFNRNSLLHPNVIICLDCFLKKTKTTKKPKVRLTDINNI